MNEKALLSDFLAHCRAGLIPDRWGIWKKSSDAWRPPADMQSTLAALINKYGRKQLIRLGLADPGSGPTLSAGPILGESQLVALRNGVGGPPEDLLTDSGCASGRLPLYASCHDYRVARGVDRFGFILAAFSLRDVIALRAIGLPATAAAGLEKFTSRSSLHFRKLFAQTSAKIPATPKRLVLVGWSPSNWSLHRPPGVDDVMRNLQSTADGLVPELLSEIYLWRPNHEQMRQIAECLGTGSSIAAVRTILRNLNESAVSLAPERANQEVSQGLAESSFEYRKEISRKHGTPKSRRRKLRTYQRAINQELIKPLLEQASTEPDVMERSRLVALAEVHQVLPIIVASCSEQMEKSFARHGLRGDDNSSDFTGMLKAFDVLCKLARRK